MRVCLYVQRCNIAFNLQRFNIAFKLQRFNIAFNLQRQRFNIAFKLQRGGLLQGGLLEFRVVLVVVVLVVPRPFSLDHRIMFGLGKDRHAPAVWVDLIVYVYTWVHIHGWLSTVRDSLQSQAKGFMHG